MILSVVPYQYFKEFVSQTKPHMLPYLRVLTLFQQWQEHGTDAGSKQELETKI